MSSVFRPRGHGVWMIQYFRNGQRVRVSSGTENKTKAKQIAEDLEGASRRGELVGPGVGKLTFGEGAELILNDYTLNGRRSRRSIEYRIRLHLQPVFGGWKLRDIASPDIDRYTVARLGAGAQVGTVNRELTALKRIFSLAVHKGLLAHAPKIVVLREHNVRKGFFERAQFEAVRAHLPVELRPVITVAYITGWRIDSELLPLDWRLVDFAAGELRLDPGTTKNGEGRHFPFTTELRTVFLARAAARDRMIQAGHVVPFVFFREVATQRGGAAKASPHVPKPITAFAKAWKAACAAAGCPGKIPHDFRRTAVRNMVRNGIPEAIAMKLTGHLTRAVFDRYNIVSDADLRQAVAKLEGLGAPLPESTATQIATQDADRATDESGKREVVRKFGGAARI